MQTIGLIGGMSWESTAVYYRMLNEQVRGRLGGFHSAEILMRSVDFDDIVNLQKQGRWDEACEVLANIARALQDGGAGCLLICTNTMHKLADDVQRAVSIRLLHIADVTANAIKAGGCKRPLLLATLVWAGLQAVASRAASGSARRACLTLMTASHLLGTY